MDEKINGALIAISAEKTRLESAPEKFSTGNASTDLAQMPKLTIGKKFDRFLHSPYRWRALGELVAEKFEGRAAFKFLRGLLTFPFLIGKLQERVDVLEMQLFEQKLKVIQLKQTISDTH
ncbi:MAG: hypothetical protein WCK17_10070 [Verrucomicrobiota bacterium]